MCLTSWDYRSEEKVSSMAVCQLQLTGVAPRAPTALGLPRLIYISSLLLPRIFFVIASAYIGHDRTGMAVVDALLRSFKKHSWRSEMTGGCTDGGHQCLCVSFGLR